MVKSHSEDYLNTDVLASLGAKSIINLNETRNTLQGQSITYREFLFYFSKLCTLQNIAITSVGCPSTLLILLWKLYPDVYVFCHTCCKSCMYLLNINFNDGQDLTVFDWGLIVDILHFCMDIEPVVNAKCTLLIIRVSPQFTKSYRSNTQELAFKHSYWNQP